MLAYKTMGNPFYHQLVLKNGTSLFFNDDHGWASSDPKSFIYGLDYIIYYSYYEEKSEYDR